MKIIKDYRAEIIFEIGILLVLGILGLTGYYNFSTSISDGTFILGIILLPVSIFSYVRTKKQEQTTRASEKKQELYNVILDEIINLLSFNDTYKYDDNIISLKTIKLEKLFESGKENLGTTSTTFEKTAINTYYSLITKDLPLSSTSQDEHPNLTLIQTRLHIIEDRLEEFDNNVPNLLATDKETKVAREHKFLAPIYKNFYWKNSSESDNILNEILGSKVEEDGEKYKQTIFYKTKFKVNSESLGSMDWQNLNQITAIEPTFILDKNLNRTKVEHRLCTEIANTDTTIEGLSYTEIENDPNSSRLLELSDSAIPEVNGLSVSIVNDFRKNIVSDRSTIKKEYASSKHTIIKFSKDYGRNDHYDWHSWFTFTNQKIDSMRADDSLDSVKFVIDNSSKQSNNFQKNSSSLIITFKKDAFVKLLEFKQEFPEFSGPNFKKFFYFNFTNKNDQPELVDTRDIKDADKIKIDVTKYNELKN